MEGAVLEDEHIPIGVLVLHSQTKNTLSLLVRTVPFGSLSCSASENQVVLYLARSSDEMGQTLSTKWSPNVKWWIDELQTSHFKREVLLPCKIVSSSQRVSVLENGIVEIVYEVREAPQHSSPKKLSDEVFDSTLPLHQSELAGEQEQEQAVDAPASGESGGTMKRQGLRSMFIKKEQS